MTETEYKIGEWIYDREFYRYHGSHAIVVESETKLPLSDKIIKSYAVLFGCIGCQLPKVKMTPKRWMILPK